MLCVTALFGMYMVVFSADSTVGVPLLQEPFVVPVAFLLLGVQGKGALANVLRELRARLELLVLSWYSRFHFEDEETTPRFCFC